jgi:hypothetical protein
MEKLERSSFEAYAGIIAGFIVALVPMSWELKLLGFAFIAAMAIDLICRSHVSYEWPRRRKAVSIAIAKAYPFVPGTYNR